MTTQEKRQPAFEDTDQIWFGKYKGEALQDVPASYLKWWYDNNIHYRSAVVKEDEKIPDYILKSIKLFNYIWNSMDAIKMELNDKD